MTPNVQNRKLKRFVLLALGRLSVSFAALERVRGAPMAPRLHFARELCEPILAGHKRATTRLDGESDPNSDLHALSAGVEAQAVTGPAGAPETFARLRVDRVDALTVGEIDDALAREEGCAHAAELVRLLKRLYPDATATTNLSGFRFTLQEDQSRG